jgi:NADP-dependent aldehyde dehydrogenase
MTTSDTRSMEQVLSDAQAAARAMAVAAPEERAGWLRGAAAALDATVDELVAIATRESRLPEQRLRGEVARTSGQMRLFADALRDGTPLELIIDTSDAEAVPVPRPDLRRMLLAVGPVLVYAAGNFPFAFSVGGGDTASAWAAGCPVVVKAHPGHPETSTRTGEILAAALCDAGAPRGALGVITGFEAGIEALKDNRVKAAAFTGSVAGGLALHEVASTRDEPIPFYGELGSINPVLVTEAAVRARGAAIAAGFVASYTLGVGQFCTKPGLLFLPSDHGLDDALMAARDVAAAPMLYSSIHDAFGSGVERFSKVPGVEVLVGGVEAGEQDSPGVRPTLLRTSARNLLDQADTLLEECFGPLALVVEYDDASEFEDAMSRVGGSLTATVHAEEDDHSWIQTLLVGVRERVGRIVWNGWPTGVAVAGAMHHGGPFPATVGSLHTSVGVTAVRRFLRPICYQDTPDALLPAELQDANPLELERRVNGQLTRDPVA